jgi:hypothetical protein
VKCRICGQLCSMALLRLGPFCSEQHRQELEQRHERLLAELRAEDVWDMPVEFDMAGFHRHMLKVALYLIGLLTPQERQHCERAAPWMLDPDEFAMDLKGRVLQALPPEYVQLRHATGVERLLHDGSYTFLKPVPALLVVDALRRVGHLPGSG